MRVSCGVQKTCFLCLGQRRESSRMTPLLSTMMIFKNRPFLRDFSNWSLVMVIFTFLKRRRWQEFDRDVFPREDVLSCGQCRKCLGHKRYHLYLCLISDVNLQNFLLNNRWSNQTHSNLCLNWRRVGYELVIIFQISLQYDIIVAILLICNLKDERDILRSSLFVSCGFIS